MSKDNSYCPICRGLKNENTVKPITKYRQRLISTDYNVISEEYEDGLIIDVGQKPSLVKEQNLAPISKRQEIEFGEENEDDLI